MKRLRYSKPHDLPQLHDELLAANIVPLVVEDSHPDEEEPNAFYVTVEDADENTCSAVVTAHVPIPKPPPSGRQLIADLRQALQNWDTLTPSQKDAVLRRCTRAVVALSDFIDDRQT